MRTFTAGIITTALAAALTVAPVGAMAAPRAPGMTADPAPAAAVTQRVDVDGDLRRDTVRLERTKVTADDYTFRLSLATASGRRAARDIDIANYDDGSLTPADVFGGTTHLDGVRGAEIRIEQGGNVGDAPWPHVYTWRAGRLVPAVAPDATASDPAWKIADHWSSVGGYSFSTVRGQRYVTSTQLRGSFVDRETLRYRGTRVTYRWTAGAWKRTGSVAVGPWTESRALDAAGWQGVEWRQ